MVSFYTICLNIYIVRQIQCRGGGIHGVVRRWRQVQGSVESYHALSLHFIFHKRALKLVAFLRKMTCNLRHPMSLRHPVCWCRGTVFPLIASHAHIRGTWSVGIYFTATPRKRACWESDSRLALYAWNTEGSQQPVTLGWQQFVGSRNGRVPFAKELFSRNSGVPFCKRALFEQGSFAKEPWHPGLAPHPKKSR